MSKERRKHDRMEKASTFYCYVNGQRFDSESLDISQGGAFLATDSAPPPLSLVVVVPREGHRVQSGVSLIGAVRREQTTPVRGVGVEWLRCVSRYGYADVREFLIQFLEISPERLPAAPQEVVHSPVAAFNFRTEGYFIPDLQASDRPESDSAQGDDIFGHLRAVLDDGLSQVTFEMPVRLVQGEASFDLLTRSVGTRAIVINQPTQASLIDGMAILHFPIPLRKETTYVRLLCSVSTAEVASTSPDQLMELRIIEMLHERSPGIFERFVRYLHERTMPTRAGAE